MLRGILNSRISYSSGNDEFVTGSQSSIPKYRTLKALRWFNAAHRAGPSHFAVMGLANGSPSRDLSRFDPLAFASVADVLLTTCWLFFRVTNSLSGRPLG
jgi:hypothetical protein